MFDKLRSVILEFHKIDPESAQAKTLTDGDFQRLQNEFERHTTVAEWRSMGLPSIAGPDDGFVMAKDVEPGMQLWHIDKWESIYWIGGPGFGNEIWFHGTNMAVNAWPDQMIQARNMPNIEVQSLVKRARYLDLECTSLTTEVAKSESDVRQAKRMTNLLDEVDSLCTDVKTMNIESALILFLRSISKSSEPNCELADSMKYAIEYLKDEYELPDTVKRRGGNPSKVVEVHSVDDLPAPVDGLIQFDSSASYIFSKEIRLPDDVIVDFNGSAVVFRGGSITGPSTIAANGGSIVGPSAGPIIAGVDLALKGSERTAIMTHTTGRKSILSNYFEELRSKMKAVSESIPNVFVCITNGQKQGLRLAAEAEEQKAKAKWAAERITVDTNEPFTSDVNNLVYIEGQTRLVRVEVSLTLKESSADVSLLHNGRPIQTMCASGGEPVTIITHASLAPDDTLDIDAPRDSIQSIKWNVEHVGTMVVDDPELFDTEGDGITYTGRPTKCEVEAIFTLADSLESVSLLQNGSPIATVPIGTFDIPLTTYRCVEVMPGDTFSIDVHSDLVKSIKWSVKPLFVPTFIDDPVDPNHPRPSKEAMKSWMEDKLCVPQLEQVAIAGNTENPVDLVVHQAKITVVRQPANNESEALAILRNRSPVCGLFADHIVGD